MDFLVDYNEHWKEVPDVGPYKNPYRFGWESFFQHVLNNTPFEHTLAAGIRDVQLAEACARSSNEKIWVDMAPVT